MILYFFYSALLILYCLIHSLLADFEIMKKYYNLWWYRLFYVAQSIVLLLPILFLYWKLPNTKFFYPNLFFRILLYLIGITGILIGYIASRTYDNDKFLGIKQVKNYFKKNERYFTEEHKLITDRGILSIIRHPYYLAGLLFIWGRPLYLKDFITNIIFTLYFIFGAINEERKLLKVYGSEYVEYQKKVPMLLPRIRKR